MKSKKPKKLSSTKSKNSPLKKKTVPKSSVVKKKPKQKKVLKESTKKKISEAVSKSIAEGRNVSKDKSNKIVRTKYSKKTWYHSEKNNEDFYADSLAESYYMALLDSNPDVKRWSKKHGIRIPYVYLGVSRYTIPDFMIIYQDDTVSIHEVKGRIVQKELIKKKATEDYCRMKNYGYKFVTTVDLDVDNGYSSYLQLFKKSKKRVQRKKSYNSHMGVNKNGTR